MIKKITIVVYIFLILIMGAATVVEALKGTELVENHVYHAIYFCALWGILSVLSVVLMIKYALWKRFFTFLLHVSFLVILFGALTTFVNGEKGYIHLRSGVESDQFILTDSKEQVTLPFAVRLDSFKVEHYPGTTAPKDYISYVTCQDKHRDSLTTAKISMNNIWINQGYRFYQTSFDEDSKGSFLTVNYDPWGTGITYSGYFLLALSMVGALFSRKETFLKLLRSQLEHGKTKSKPGVGKLKGAILPFLLFVSIFSHSGEVLAQPMTSLPALKISQADSLRRQQVIYNDRVAPFNTLARDFVLKIYGKDHYKSLTPEQVLGGWILFPDRWREEPVIYIKSDQLRVLLGLSSDYASLKDLFNGDTYRLQDYYAKGNEKLDKAIWEVDEKVGLISMLLQGTLIKPVAAGSEVEPLSDAKVNAELFYNSIPFCKILFIINLTAGLLGLMYLFHVYIRKSDSGKNDRVARRVLVSILYLVTLTHAVSYSLHGYIAGHLPLGNGYETMIFMALVILIFSCILRHKYSFVVPFGLLLSGFGLLVAYLGQSNPQITPLMPVLLSPWLSSHVSLIMMSYALLGFIMLNGVFALGLMYVSRNSQAVRDRHAAQIEQLTILSRILLYPAVFFLGIGIFLGAVWANESWGRYWAWDPKEVWALITFMVYGAAFHLQSVRVFNKPKFYHIYMVLAFLTVLMTYFGVNYVLGGMHSYA